MHVETKFLRLFRAVELGDDLDGWRVCWLGGWDKCRVLFVVMVKRVTDVSGSPRYTRCFTNAPRRAGGASLEEQGQPSAKVAHSCREEGPPLARAAPLGASRRGSPRLNVHHERRRINQRRRAGCRFAPSHPHLEPEDNGPRFLA